VRAALLMDEPPVVVQPSLVRALGGMPEAAVVQQLHYWTQRATREHEGQSWVYKTYDDWSAELGLTTKAARGALNRLRTKGVAVGIQNPTDPRDRTLWWRVDYQQLDALATAGSPSAQEGRSSDQEGSPTAPDGSPPAPEGRSNAGASQESPQRLHQRTQAENEDLSDARVERAHDPIQPTELEAEAIDGLAAVVGLRGRFLTDLERRGIVAAARAADGIDPSAAVRRLERYYGADGPGAARPITDVVALFVAELGRSARPEPEQRLAFRREPRRPRSAAPALAAAPAPTTPRPQPDPPTPSARTKWDRARAALREAVSDSTWGIWLEHVELAGTLTTLITEAGDDSEQPERELVLQAPANKLRWLETRFRRLIGNVLEDEFGPEVTVSFVETPAQTSNTRAAA